MLPDLVRKLQLSDTGIDCIAVDKTGYTMRQLNWVNSSSPPYFGRYSQEISEKKDKDSEVNKMT